MRPVREITAKQENFRIVGVDPFGFDVIRRDPIEPEPVGTIILKAFRITGYDPDCDGSLMARLENIDGDGDPTGYFVRRIGVDPSTTLVVIEDELRTLFATDT